MTSHAVFLQGDNCNTNNAVTLAAISKKLLAAVAHKGS